MRQKSAIKQFGWVFMGRTRAVGGVLVVTGLFLILIAGLVLVQPAQAGAVAVRLAAPAQQDAAQGQQIFNEKCAGCHTIGGGDLLGPDLIDVTKRRDPQWIKNFISDPAKMIASDAAAKELSQKYSMVMPALGLSDAELDAVLVYLGDPGAAPAAPAAVPGTGNAAVGQKVFTGEQQLANGGPSCIACHSVSGTGALGGGALGPDLTHVIQRMGEPGLSASLKTIVFPTMLGPFQNKPLTAAEQADLAAFFKQAGSMQPAQPSITPGALTANAVLVFVIGLAGTLLLFGLLLVIWSRHNRYRTTRLPVRKV